MTSPATPHSPLVAVEQMYFHYPRAKITAGGAGWTLQDISLSINLKSTVGIVGESGSGKSTLIRVMCGLLRHQQGNVQFNGKDITATGHCPGPSHCHG